MDNTQTLEMQIKANAESAISSVNKLITGLTDLENNVQKITTKLDANGKVVSQTISTTRKEGDKLYSTLQKIDKKGNLSTTATTMTKLKNETSSTTEKMKNFKNTTNSTAKNIAKLNKAFSATSAYLGAKKLTSVFLDWMDLAIDRTEQLNLFNVVFKNIEVNGKKTFSELGKSATKFQNELQEKFGTNITETLKYQGLFQSMGENVGIEDTYSAIMSETMTKLTYDLASLYNKSESTVAEALRAGVYAGQTKPLRSYGIDVTQTSMQPILDSLGISNRTIKQMSQAEKEILRYLATLKQAQVAMGDMANTIESPSNQIKIFKQQLVEAKVALSNLFIGTFAKILPYANALLMVVTQVAKAIADMFGIEITDYNSGIASSEDAYYDLSDSIDNATDSVKELKRQTLGFDQINNINENNNNGSTVTGGIDQRLLDAIYGYDNGMDKVRMKATEIRDRIMEWLGFTKEVDSETGKISFKFTDTNSTLYKVVTKFKELYDAGKKIVKEVWNKLTEDFQTGIFGDIFVGVLDTISNLFNAIAENDVALELITKFVEAMIVLKGLSLIPGFSTVIGLLKSNLTGALTKAFGASQTLVGTAGASITAVGASGLLGILGILGIITAGVWTINLVYESVTATKEVMEQTSQATNDMTDSTHQLTLKMAEMHQQGGYTTEQYQIMTDALDRGIKRSADYVEQLEDQKTWLAYVTGASESYKAQQDQVATSIEGTAKVVEALHDAGAITDEQYKQLSKTIEEARQKIESMTTKTYESKVELKNFSDEINNTKGALIRYGDSSDTAKSKINNFSKSVVGGNDNLKLLQDNLKSLQSKNISVNVNGNSSGLSNSINQFNGAKITVSVDGNTNSLKNSLNSAFTDSRLASLYNNLPSLRANGGIYNNGQWHNIPQYANGGIPSHGTMFVAGEAGAEVVGHINGRTEVLNQSQIASAIYSAVLSAMTQSGGQTTQVDVHVHTDEGTVVDRINQTTKQTGICPINIPV